MSIFRKTVSPLQFLLFLVLLGLIIGMSSHLWSGDILFHTDVARDLMILQEMVATKQPTLIGARSSLSGIFHGPLWYYICLIPFVIGGGDPIFMGWFWWLTGISGVLLFLYVCHKLTKQLTASLLATICFALLELPSAVGPTNTYLANIFAFIPFILWWQWYQKPKWILSILGWFSLGILVQFQMAFTIPIAILWMPIFIWKSLKEKKIKQLFSFFVFLLPLATFLLFDLRHDWIQIRSLMNYFHASQSSVSFSLRIMERIHQTFIEGVRFLGFADGINVAVVALFLYLGFKSKKKWVSQLCWLGGYWYLGWWMLTLVFSGTIWNFYFDSFVGIILIMMAVVASQARKAWWLLIIVTISIAINARVNLIYYSDRFDSSSWLLLSTIAADSLQETSTGYFVYSQDQLAYPLKYAFSFYSQNHPELGAIAYIKKPITILVKSPDDPRNPWSTSEYWQKNKLYILLEPVKKKVYPHGYMVEKYYLDEETINKPIDPNLVTGMQFR